MYKACISDHDFGRAHHALAGIVVPRRQSPHQQQIDPQIEVAGNRLAIDAESAREGRGVERR